MKVQTLIKKLFGNNSIQYYSIDEDDKDTVLEYYNIQLDDDACEPDYFIRLFTNGTYRVTDINSTELFIANDEKELKNFMKVLAQNNK